MIEGTTGEDEWVAHELAGHVHDEQVLVWDEAISNDWPAELRCSKCSAVRYLQRNEAVHKIAERNLAMARFQYADGSRIYGPGLRQPTATEVVLEEGLW